MKGFEDMIIQKDYKVFYQTNNEKAWLGPAKVFNEYWVIIAGNGDIKKVPKCNVKLNVKASNKIIDLEEEKEGQVKANGPCPTDLEDNNENKDKNEVTFEDFVRTK